MLRLTYLVILYWWYGGSLSTLSEEVKAERSGEGTPTTTASAADNASPAPASGSRFHDHSTSLSAAELGNAESGIRTNRGEAQSASDGDAGDSEQQQRLLKRVSIVDKLTALTVLTSFVSDLDLCADWYFLREGLEGESAVISRVALAFTVLGTVMYVLLTVEFHFVSKIWTLFRGGKRLTPLQHVPLGWQLFLNVLVEDIPQLVITCITSPSSVAGALNIATAGFALLAKTTEGFETRHDLPMSAQLHMVEEEPVVVRHMVVRQREAKEQAVNAARLAVSAKKFKQERGSGKGETDRRLQIALGVMRLDPGFLNGKLNFIREKLEGPNLVLEEPQRPIKGPIPPALGTLTGLQEIVLKGAKLNGPVPSELGSLSRLKLLDLSSNQLKGPVPSELESLSRLTVLNLSNNPLEGLVPSELWSLSRLTVLDLHDIQLEAPVPSKLWALSGLTVLNLSDNALEGPVPSELRRLSRLAVLDLGGNQLEGPIPTELGSLSALTKLFLSSNKLTGSIPRQLGELRELRVLDLGLNQLEGAIPMELGSMTKLEELYLQWNKLSATIPPQLGKLAALQELWVERNLLRGSIPPALGGLTALWSLDLHGNQLAGSIPPELGGLTALEELLLSDNQLAGSIPPELVGLTALHNLDLSDNQLVGSIPNELGQLKGLRKAAFYRRNNFSGTKAEVRRLLPGSCSVKCSEQWHPSPTRTTAMLRLTYLVILYWWYGGSLSTVLEEVKAESSGEGTPTTTASAADNASPAPSSGSRLHDHSTSSSAAELANAESGIRANRDEAQSASDGDHELEQRLLKRVSIVDKLTALTVLTSFVSDLDLCADWYFLREGLEGESAVISRVALAFTVIGTVMYVLLTVEFHFVNKIWTLFRGGERLSPLQHVPLGWQLFLNVLVEDIPQLVITWITSPSSVAGALNIATAGFALLAKTAEGFETWHDLPMSAQLRMVEEEPGVVRHMVVRQREADEQAANAARLAVFVNDFKQVRGSGEGATERRVQIALGVMRLDPGFLNGKMNFIREKLEGPNLVLQEPLQSIKGPIPPALGTLTGLQEIVLVDAKLNGPVPSELGSLSRLTVLNLGYNQLEGPVPSELGSLSRLTVLDLSDNQLEGPIPTELGSLGALTRLDLSANKLSGSIPRQLGDLRELRLLQLGYNELEGAIPMELGNMTKLEQLYLRWNKLSATIPPQLGELAALKKLWVERNLLTGSIPPELGGLSALRSLDLSDNQLAGSIPKELGQLKGLRRADFSGNKFSGK
eukprot:g7332.t1